MVIDKRETWVCIGKQVGFGNGFRTGDDLAKFQMSSQILIEIRTRRIGNGKDI